MGKRMGRWCERQKQIHQFTIEMNEEGEWVTDSKKKGKEQ